MKTRTRAGGGIRGPAPEQREATFWRVMVKRSVDGQWQLFIKRSGQVVLVGETRKSKAGVVKTAQELVRVGNIGGMFQFDGVLQ